MICSTGIHNKVTKSELEFEIAEIILYYPGRPQEANAITILRKFPAGNLEALPSRMTTPNSEIVFKRLLQRIIDLLSTNGNFGHHDWVKHKFHVLLQPATGIATPTRERSP